jgi:hypothetical protein
VSEQSEHVSRVDFFRPPQKPNGGTVYVRPASTPVFRVTLPPQRPNGGGTVFVKPSDSEEGSVDSEG